MQFTKVQSLLDTIHQKDLEIAKLKEMLGLSDKADVMPMENSKSKSKKKKHKKKDKEKDGKEKKDDKNKKGKDKNAKLKSDKGKKGAEDNSSDESSDEGTSEENDKDNSLFEEKEKKVNILYNKVKDKLSKIQEENARINIIQNEEEELRKIQLKIDSFNKAIHNYIKDKDKNKCFIKMDDMIKQSILMVKNVDYKKGFDEYKENLNKIFDDNIKNLKSQKDLSNCFNIYFFYEYLRFYFNNQIIIQGYRKLILDNRSLEKMNTYLFDIVHDILSVNFDMANDNVINANALNLLKASLVGDSFVQNPGLLHGANFERNSLGKKLTLTIGNELHQKIIKIVSRKNLNLLKNSFASPGSQKASLAVNDPKNAQNALNLMNATPEANIALINKVKSQETEKSESKLQMIRNVLIQEIKETDSIKKNMEELKEYINNIINLNINFFNQKILNGKGNLSLVTQKKVIKDSVENLQNNLEDDNTEYIAIETNIAITNNKVENVENKNKEEKKDEDVEKISEEKSPEQGSNHE